MAPKNKSVEPILKQYSLPASDVDLRKFIDTKKVDMMEQTLTSIEYAIDNKLPAVEVFQFSGSDFVVLLSNKDFLPNIDHIYDYYLSNEMYEFCNRVLNLKKRLGVTFKLNEKKTY